ncbi:hypothetical protein LshimejAT787_0702760 [Lyophyllum shimeji]|uniref:Uncharacterized protein n=1 Tax=Lyophyllum shimeji TaxID=47721 RepID=A0A9P3PQZ8_LYOSH|nr:hypothetical protein LshimejAT787_0702760 [Lyophyllum shimeji]
MFFKLASFLAVVALSTQAAIVSRTDVTREVYIPEGQTIDDFCTEWHDTCVAIAHRIAKAYDRCGAGYDGPGTARVDCLALTGTPATDVTDQVVQKLGLTYVSP